VPLGCATTETRARALVVAHDEAMRRFVADALSDAFAVVTAADGWAGLEMASEPALDLIITEIALPRMSVEELIVAIRRQPHLDGVPILIISAKADEPARAQLLRDGAQDYVVSPFSAEELRARAINLAGVKRLRDVEAASVAKDEFLAMLSHELRTPLNAILGWVSILQRADIGEAERTRATEVIARNARAQARLVDDLLDVSAMIRGRLRLSLEPVPLRPVLDEAIDTARPAADAKRIALHWHCDAGDLVVTGDGDRLRQVIHNLLVNAIKFTPEDGYVMVRVGRADDVIAIAVEDTGVGIAPELLPHVFERFAQGTPGTTSIARGLGLGLAIVRQLVELHGGAVEATSAGLGQGATFTVRLPAVGGATALSALPATTASTRLLGVRVLFVEDDEDTRQMVASALERYGAIVEPVSSVRAAMERLDGFRPDLLLSDIGLPEEDGYELMRLVRSQGRRIPSIALTAYTRPEDRQTALSAGYWHHVGKPVDIGELVTTISTVATMKREDQ
jgi:signal transduction histidine kinase/ActR/RegA family two-component response regulator